MLILPKARLIAGRGGLPSSIHRHHVKPIQAFQNHPTQQLKPSTVAFHNTLPPTALGMSSSFPEVVNSIDPVKAVVPALGVLSLFVYLKYRFAIRKRLKQINEESWIFGVGVTMERVTDNTPQKKSAGGAFQNLRLLELNPEFKHKAKEEGFSLLSLGDYMSSLRPKELPKQFSVDDMPKVIQQEIEAGLAAGLLKALGPNLGRALLPAVGIGPIQSKAQGIASSIATKWFMSEDGSISESGDKGGIPVSLMTLLAISDTNARVNGGKVPKEIPGIPNPNLSAMEKMKLGEIGHTPSFVDPGTNGEVLVPNNGFVVNRDFDNVILRMEEKLRAQGVEGHNPRETKMAQNEIIDEEDDEEMMQDPNKQDEKLSAYDPEDRKMADPVPINPRLFPDLHLGWGDAECSHTKREVLKMRLFATLLNKLGSNYYKEINGQDNEIFSLQMSENEKPITTPWEFVQALIDSGHDIHIVPSSRLTSFGVALSVKEKDGSWSNIPIGAFLESGFEDKNGIAAPAMMPHSGLDMVISGPLAGKRADGTPSALRIQHFVSVEGFCGWHPHEHAEIPWNEAIECGERLQGQDAVRAARIAGLYANVMNGLATKLHLPFGGYGLTAVCNDSAALVQQCLYDNSTIYPMTSIGRFLQRTMRYAQTFAEELSQHDGMEEEIKDLLAITDAMKKIPSDLNASPADAPGAARRMLQTLQPKMPFVLMNDAKRVMESILEEEEAESSVVEEKEKVEALR